MFKCWFGNLFKKQKAETAAVSSQEQSETFSSDPGAGPSGLSSSRKFRGFQRKPAIRRRCRSSSAAGPTVGRQALLAVPAQALQAGDAPRKPPDDSADYQPLEDLLLPICPPVRKEGSAPIVVQQEVPKIVIYGTDGCKIFPVEPSMDMSIVCERSSDVHVVVPLQNSENGVEDSE